MREEKGITLIALVITVIVLIILIGVSIGAAGGMNGDISKTQDVVAMSNINKVQQGVLEAYVGYKKTGNVNYLKGEKVSYADAKNIEEEFQKISEVITLKQREYDLLTVDPGDCYYKVDKRQLKTMGMTNLSNTEEYMVNYATGEVFNLNMKKTVGGIPLYVDSKKATEEYVNTGLLIHYDGINNTGGGHNGATNIWTDLSGHGNDATLTGFQNTNKSGWLSNGLKCGNTSEMFKTADIDIPSGSSFSVSVTFKEDKFVKYGESNHQIFKADKGWYSFAFHTWYSNSTTQMLDGTVYIGGNYTNRSDGKDNRFTPAEMNGYKTKEGRIDNITYTYNGNTKTAKLYINSLLVATEEHSINPQQITNFQSGIGNNKTYYSIMVYDREISQSEVIHNYEIDSTRFKTTPDYIQSGLLAQYDAINNTGNGHDRASTIWKDLSGNGNDGTLHNFANSLESGWQDNCIAFDGEDDYITIPESETTNPFEQTIEIVMKCAGPSLNSIDGRQIFFVKWRGYTMEINSAGLQDRKIFYGRRDGYLGTTNPIQYGKIYSIVAKNDGTTSRIYLNNLYENQQSVVPEAYSLMNEISIGNYNGRNDNRKDNLNGSIYAIRMYNRALTDEELTHNYEIDKERYGIE